MVTFGIQEYLRILARYRRALYINLFGVTVLTVVLSLLWPKTYVATATLIPAFDIETPFSKLLDYRAIDLSLVFGEQQLMPSNIYAGIMKSRTLMEVVIDKCELMRLYGKRSREDMLVKLARMSTIDVSKDGLISVTVKTNDANLSALVANVWVAELDAFNKHALMSQAKKKRVFIQTRIEAVRDDLARANDSLIAFQARYKTASLRTEIRAAVTAYAELAVDLIRSEIQLHSIPDAEVGLPLAQEMRNRIAAFKKKLRTMENEWGRGHGIGFAIPLGAVPRVEQEFANLLRNKDLLDTIYSFLIQALEDAMIEEVRNTPTIVVIDEAKPPEKRIWPYRTRIVAMGWIIAGCITLLIPLFGELSNTRDRHE